MLVQEPMPARAPRGGGRVMSHCVVYAFWKYVSEEGIGFPYDPLEFYMYSALRDATAHGLADQTFGGIIPLVYRILARMRNLEFVAQHRLWSADHYIALLEKSAEDQRGAFYTQAAWFGDLVDEITLAPAVYLDLHMHHAFYAKAVPDSGCIIMAAQFIPKEDDHGTGKIHIETEDDGA